MLFTYIIPQTDSNGKPRSASASQPAALPMVKPNSATSSFAKAAGPHPQVQLLKVLASAQSARHE